jgi:dethiobiotin synthetase
LKQHKIEIKGIVFNGEPNSDSEKFILSNSGLKHLFSLPELELTKEKISLEAKHILPHIKNLI